MRDNSEAIYKINDKDNPFHIKEKILSINCINCTYEKDIQFFPTNFCIECISKILIDNIEKKIENLIVNSNNGNKFRASNLKLFRDFYLKREKIEGILKSIKNHRHNSCLNRKNLCPIPNDIIKCLNKNDPLLKNPISLYFDVIQTIGNLNDISLKNNCKTCLNNLKIAITLLKTRLEKFEIIKKTLFLYPNLGNTNDFNQAYINLLFKQQFNKLNAISEGTLKDKEFNLIDSYYVGKNRLFKISIHEKSNEFEKVYSYTLDFSDDYKNESFYSRMAENLIKSVELISSNDIIPLEDLVSLYSEKIHYIISDKYELEPQVEKSLVFYSTLRFLNLENIFPLFLDDLIEEIFLDNPVESIYLNHQTYGRCRTKIKLNPKEIERLKTFIRLYSGERLDHENPTIKFVMKNNFFHCRFSIDIDPISISKFSLDIRKLNKNIFTIQDLLKNDTLNPRIAAFLYFCLLRRKNITVIGETDTGKTTFINSLDLLTPKHFRKIYVEEAIESLNQQNLSRHQLKYKVDPDISLNEIKYSKSNQIRKLLHRSPDIIYLGEILTKEEAEALFHCLSAGLKGFQTIHTSDIDSLINRFLYHFKIEISCLNDLDLLVLTKKSRFKRKIFEIAEILPYKPGEGVKYRSIFRFNPHNQKWKQNLMLFETKIIDNIRIYEDLSKNRFNTIISLYENTFNLLLEKQRLTLKQISEIFDKISYFSYFSLRDLESYLILLGKEL